VTVCQPHLVEHSLVICLFHKTIQWRESADRQQFQIAHGTA
jgi:hypothetical protein